MRVEIEQEVDGRWIAEVVEVPGALAYGQTPEEAVQYAQELSRRILTDPLTYRERD